MPLQAPFNVRCAGCSATHAFVASVGINLEALAQLHGWQKVSEGAEDAQQPRLGARRASSARWLCLECQGGESGG